MLRYRFHAITLLLFLFTLAGCAGTIDSMKASVEKVINSAKAYSEEEQGNTAYDRKDYKTAFARYKTAAELGGSHGQFMLSNMYLAGEGVQRNRKESFRWLQQSAKNGYPPANYLMGRASLPKYPVTAVKYFKAAAEKEHGSSMHMLGLMYASGAGVEQNSTEALRWFRLARAQGFPVEENLLSEEGIRKFSKQAGKTAEQIQKTALERQKLVREIQEKLTELGYNPGPVDGLYGNKTKVAIQGFQQKKGLRVDGLATPELLEELNRKSWLPW